MKSFAWGRWALAVAAAAAIAMWPVWSSNSHPDEAHTGESADLDFVVKDMHGKDVRLASFKGQPIILNFWATWCGPCKAEIPALNELARKYEDQELVVLGISVDDTPEDLKAFTADFKIDYPVLIGREQNRLQEVYDSVLWVPVTWYIRPDGSVFLKHRGPASTEWFEEQLKIMLSQAAERP